MKLKKFRFSRAVCAIIVAGLSNGSYSQTTTLEEIIVTAQKREQSLQEVPISIQAFSGEDIAQLGIEELEDISMRTSNVVLTAENVFGGEASTAATIRGLRGVGIYIDGVYEPFGNNLLQSNIFDVEQISVLRGPQGTLFGRNTQAGAIQITTAGPSEDFQGNVTAGFGTDSRVDVSGSVSIPFSDSFRSKFSVAYTEADGYMENLNPATEFSSNPDIGDRDNLLYRADFEWDITEDLSARFIYTHNEFDQAGVARVNVSDEELGGGQALDLDANDVPETAVLESYADSYWEDRDTWNLNLSYQINDNLSVRSITAGSSRETGNIQDVDTLPGLVSHPLQDGTVRATTAQYNEAEGFSQELQLLGSYDNFDFVLGAYYWDEEQDEFTVGAFSPARFYDGFEGNAVFLDVSFDVTEKLSASFGVRRDSEDVTDRTYAFTDDQIDLVLSYPLALDFYAVFTPPTFDLDVPATLDLAAAANEQFDEAYANFRSAPIDVMMDSSGGLYTAGDTANFISDTTRTANTITADTTTIKANLSYQFTDDVMAFITYSEGHRAGGTNIVDADFDGDGSNSTTIFTPADPFNPVTPNTWVTKEFLPEEVNNIDVGIRSELVDGRLRLNATAFFADYKNVQVNSDIFYDPGAFIDTNSDFVPDTLVGPDDLVNIDGELFTANAAEAEAKGFELEINWLATDNLSIDATYGYTDTAYTSLSQDVLDAGYNLGTPFFASPENSYTLGATWRSDFGGGTLVAGLNYAWKDDQIMTTDQRNLIGQVDYATLNGRISYLDGGNSWQVSLIGRNITDERYFTSLFPAGFGTVATISEPAFFGAEFQYSF